MIGENHPKTIESIRVFGKSPPGEEHAETELIMRDITSLTKDTCPASTPSTSPTWIDLGALAGALSQQSKYEEAELIYRDILAAEKATLPEHSTTWINMSNLALNLTDQGKFVETEGLLHEVLVTRERLMVKSTHTPWQPQHLLEQH
jgi:hypothetical protein